MTRIKLALADDNESFRKALIRLLHLEPDFEVIAEAKDGIDLLQKLEVYTPDIVIMDVRMPNMDGIESTRRIREVYPHLKVVAYSQYDIEDNIIKMNIEGVKSFIGKEDEPQELFLALRVVHKGNVYMTSRVAHIIQRHLKGSFKEKCPFQLTDMERILLNGINNGMSSTQLGEMICKSPRTVEKYVADMYRKFNITSKVELIKLISKWKIEDAT
jgi:DNA-binding NarL/FixJ family response regulator